MTSLGAGGGFPVEWVSRAAFMDDATNVADANWNAAAVSAADHETAAAAAAAAEDSLLVLRDTVRPGENFTFQVALIAPAGSSPASGVVLARTELRNVSLSLSLEVEGDDGGAAFSSSSSKSSLLQPLRDLRCLNLEGVDFWGRPFRSAVAVKPGALLPLWFATEIDAAAAAAAADGVIRADLWLVLRDPVTHKEDQRYKLPFLL
jgi:hypothetical protein